MFEIRNIKFRNILDIKFLNIDKPITCVVGPSGSGKTTLLRMLNRLNVPDEGVILYNNKDISKIDTILLRRNVVMLGQTPVIYSGNIEDNLQIGLEFSKKLPVSKSRMKEILERVELNKKLTDGCGNLSGGEKQRLCLARVMLMDADTYLLDEPSAALDKDTEQFIIDNFSKFVLENNKELIMITHSEQIAQKYNNSIVRIENGEVVKSYYE
ncbi:ABC transporter ATP-binding protein [Clostridium beijerinckii]|jgi:ABC-type transport system involved in cytochrome bd biosynthesis, ATPase and permease components|uniref:ATP-binding cassette domain-containing protein n=2 Tax=Clostridium beijerinckii TaxID=1520 RepID=A0AAE2UZB2_CLOBE|nr:ABC transporter ATP-binding protein [Clostridium beijerinckii]ABR34730.1 ABC transporter related [Clostridium beijerinckii NCIMB 8052]AIU01601.1 ABC transporter related protein [Clostridium beijerinckii ATCC 35702]ALB46177.1 ATP-binding cassette domain-containing protein [Clostridium beijerinckii NRRL B-598]MBF7810640.1 ATP-binding cassette domain-containing protein [Clostridium beijerinckii]NOW91361.1 putative ABC transport system ATP-binding protein [Clostridium beijerinckii]